MNSQGISLSFNLLTKACTEDSETVPSSVPVSMVMGGTLDLSALAGSQLVFAGSFWTNGSTVLKFPGDMTLAECTAKINMGSKPVGEQIVVQGVTYTWDGTSWGGQA